MDLIKAFTDEQLKKGNDVPQIHVGDDVRVHNRIKEGAKTRIQMYEGTVIAKRGGGISATFTVRRVSYGQTHCLRLRRGENFPVAFPECCQGRNHPCR